MNQLISKLELNINQIKQISQIQNNFFKFNNKLQKVSNICNNIKIKISSQLLSINNKLNYKND